MVNKNNKIDCIDCKNIDQKPEVFEKIEQYQKAIKKYRGDALDAAISRADPAKHWKTLQIITGRHE